jgi:hypothetical protein
MTKFTRDIYNEIDLLHLGRDHFHTGQFLLSSYAIRLTAENHEELITTLDSGGYLVHLGLELTLKAFTLNISGEFEDIHKLETLVEKSGMDLKKYSKLIKEIEKYYYCRYGKDKENTIILIGNEKVHEYDELYNKIISKLPGSLSKKFKNIKFNKKAGRSLMEKKINPK